LRVKREMGEVKRKIGRGRGIWAEKNFEKVNKVQKLSERMTGGKKSGN